MAGCSARPSLIDGNVLSDRSQRPPSTRSSFCAEAHALPILIFVVQAVHKEATPLARPGCGVPGVRSGARRCHGLARTGEEMSLVAVSTLSQAS